MGPNRVTHLLNHLIGCHHVLRQGYGEAAIYVRLEPGTRAVQAADQQQATARAEGVVL